MMSKHYQKATKRWFAWRPVRVKGKLVWLRFIERTDYIKTYWGY